MTIIVKESTLLKDTDIDHKREQLKAEIAKHDGVIVIPLGMEYCSTIDRDNIDCGQLVQTIADRMHDNYGTRFC